MAEAHDPLERELDRLVAPASDPAPAFLRAVGRRRAERRVRHASVVGGAIVLVGGGVFLFSRSGVPATPQAQRPIALDSAPLRGTIGSMRPTEDPARVVPPPGARGAPAAVIYASDWRSEEKLAVLAGRS